MKEPVVMIVDDEPDVQYAISLLLKSVNHQVDVFVSAQDYWSRFDPEQPGCLILDVRMPGMSGIELQGQLNQLDYQPPIIMILGHGEPTMAVNAVRSGAIDFLTKPVSDQLLLERVSQALQKDQDMRAAHDLSVSTRTIEIHRAHVMGKMEADSLSSLMRYVSVLEENGILDRTQCTT